MENKTAKYIGRAFLFLMAAVFVFPFLISILLAFKTKQETTKSVLALPEKLHFENFTEAIEKANILRSMGNSIVITVGSVILVLIVASMAGYAIGRQYHKRGFRLYESILTASMMIPFQTVLMQLLQLEEHQ